MHALIDGDWILYAAGFAGQKEEHVVPSLFGARVFRNVTEIRQAVLEEDEDSEWDPQQDPGYSRIVLDPPEFFYHSAKNMIETQLQKIGERFKIDTVNYTVLMDGDGNFRSRLATIRPYKGTRHVHAKPHMYNELRQYLLDVWDAEVVHGQETDDEMAIRQTAMGDKSIIVAVDKDMLQVPGYHLNPNKGFKKVSPEGGDLFLYRQCLTGDSVDNIAGCYKCGPKAAEKVLPNPASQQDLWDAVVAQYESSMEKYPSHYPEGMTAEDAAIENMRLVFLRREPEQLWVPPGV
jgi:hypothetical protein